MEQVFTTEVLPSDPTDWPRWRKTAVTSAIKVDGPFTVQTSEGPLHCEDGYLAMDARGYPYPIATDEFALIYKPALDSGNLSDRELTEFIADNIVGLVGLMQGIRDQVAPTLERLGPALKMMGLGG